MGGALMGSRVEPYVFTVDDGNAWNRSSGAGGRVSGRRSQSLSGGGSVDRSPGGPPSSSGRGAPSGRAGRATSGGALIAWEQTSVSSPSATPTPGSSVRSLPPGKSRRGSSPAVFLGSQDEGETKSDASRRDNPQRRARLGRGKSAGAGSQVLDDSRQRRGGGGGGGGAGGAGRGLRNAQMSEACPWIVKNAEVGSVSPSQFQQSRVIGMGLMGTVRIARWKGEQAYCVLKAVRKDYVCRHNDGRHIRNERDILRQMTSPFVVRLFGTAQDADNIFFVMEYVAGGELFRRLRRKEHFPPDTAKFYAVEIFCALEHVHSFGYVYRDLKPENVLLDEDGHCKLVDFGFATRPNADGVCKTDVGTPAYLSPEQLNGKFTNGYTSIVDWWSFGCVIYEMLTGKPPFCKSNKETPYEIYLRVLRGHIPFPWRGFPMVIRDLVKKLLHHDTAKRLCDSESIKHHEWLDCDWHAVQARHAKPPFEPRLREPGDTHYFDSYGDVHSGHSGPIDQSIFADF